MSNNQMSTLLRGQLAAAVIVATLLWPAGVALAGTTLGTVYYQALHSDGQISHLKAVPRTDENIKSVLRVAAIGSRKAGSVILSTEGKFMRRRGADRTFQTSLIWSGQAWVGSAADRRRRLTRITEITTAYERYPEKTSRRQQARRLNDSLAELFNQRAFWALAAVDIEADMFEHAGTPEAGRSRWDLYYVREVQANIDRAILQRNQALEELDLKSKLKEDYETEPIAPTGEISPTEPGPTWANADGVVSPFEEIHVLPWRVQVWRLATRPGRRKYHISMAHAEAGTFGAFYYVAYADTTGDGLPDTPIARSRLAQSQKAGQWTSWSFISNAEVVFIGQAWPLADTAVYCRRESGANWRGMSREVYISPILGRLPRRPGGAYVTNCRVHSIEMPPEPPSSQPAAGDGESTLPAE